MIVFWFLYTTPFVFGGDSAIEFSKQTLLKFDMLVSEAPQDINEARKHQAWKKQPNIFNFGFLEKPIWFKIPIKNTLSVPQTFVLRYSEGFVYQVDFYIERNNQTHYATRSSDGFSPPLYEPLEYIPSGSCVEPSKRQFYDIFPTATVEIAPHEELVVYVKFVSKSSSFGRFELFTLEDYFKSFRNYTMMYAFYFGLLWMVIFYNIVMGTLSPDKKIYLFYASYVFFIFLWGLLRSGYYRYFLGHWVVPLLSAAIPVAFIFSILFAMRLFDVQLQTNGFSRRFLTLFIWLLVFATGVILIDFSFGLNVLIYQGIVMIFAFIVLLIGLAVQNKERFIHIYMTLFVPFLVSTGLFGLIFAGLLYPSYLLSYLYIFASMIEVGGFSFLLAYRMNLLHSEKMQEASKRLFLQKNYAKDLEYKVQEQTLGLKSANEKLQINLQERELLLQEVYHRVKNNLQLIVSLIWLQDKKTDNQVLKDALGDIANRIKSIAITHELLYASNDLVHISSRDYITKLIFALKDTTKDHKTKLSWRICDMELDLQNALYLGIIISEVFSNAIKHNKIATIKKVTILFRRNKNNRVALLIRDNGQGFDCEDKKVVKNFGVGLIKQLSGVFPSSEYKYFFKQGTIFCLEFDA